jgi:hypothetical protein
MGANAARAECGKGSKRSRDARTDIRAQRRKRPQGTIFINWLGDRTVRVPRKNLPERKTLPNPRLTSRN